jgi:hypothetical protein
MLLHHQRNLKAPNEVNKGTYSCYHDVSMLCPFTSCSLIFLGPHTFVTSLLLVSVSPPHVTSIHWRCSLLLTIRAVTRFGFVGFLLLVLHFGLSAFHQICTLFHKLAMTDFGFLFISGVGEVEWR